MAVQLQRLGVSPGAGHVEFFDAVQPDSAQGFPSLGARGCFESHLQVLTEAERLGLRRVLILEDDLNFERDYAVLEQAVLPALQREDWAMFFGGYRLDQAVPAGRPLVTAPPGLQVYCTHFVALQGPAIGAAAGYLRGMLTRAAGDPAGGPMHVDGAYSWFRQANPDLRVLLASPQLGYQRASRSDIHALSWRDRWPLVRSLVARLRQLRH